MPSSPPHILIVGAGIGGLALAIALRQRGLASTIWERATELREIGAGLLLTANATWILQRLGLFEEACKAGRITRQWDVLDRQGRRLQSFPQNQKQPSISITRSAFQRLLLAELPAQSVLLDRELKTLSATEPGSPFAVENPDGANWTPQLMVGADGGNSAVRGVFSNLPPRMLDYVGWRGLAKWIPPGWEGGRISESWGDGCRFGIAPVGPEWTYWYATENVTDEPTMEIGDRKTHLLRRFQNWHAPVCDLIEATQDGDILLGKISEHRTLRTWHLENVTLLGDAAHLMSPNLGQGAAMALEDAWALATCLAEEGVGLSALQRYEALRRKRTAQIVWQSHQIGRLIQLEHPALTAVRDLALRMTPDWVGNRTLASVFDFRG